MINDDDLRGLADACKLKYGFVKDIGLTGTNPRGVQVSLLYMRGGSSVSVTVGGKAQGVFTDINELAIHFREIEFVTDSDLEDGGLGSRLFITSDQSQCTESLLHHLRRIEARIDRLLA